MFPPLFNRRCDFENSCLLENNKKLLKIIKIPNGEKLVELLTSYLTNWNIDKEINSSTQKGKILFNKTLNEVTISIRHNEVERMDSVKFIINKYWEISYIQFSTSWTVWGSLISYYELHENWEYWVYQENFYPWWIKNRWTITHNTENSLDRNSYPKRYFIDLVTKILN